MTRLTKQYEDTKRYYSTHTCDEVLQKLGKLEDKEEPKKPKPVKMFGHTIMRRCPVCNTRPLVDYSLYYKQKYCGNCGQAIDWSDEDEKETK